jgi:hypothetical protein
VRAVYVRTYDFGGTNTDNLTLPDCNLITPGACNVAFTTGKNNISVTSSEEGCLIVAQIPRRSAMLPPSCRKCRETAGATYKLSWQSTQSDLREAGREASCGSCGSFASQGLCSALPATRPVILTAAFSRAP